jgi:succinate dehydrogenase/fumarate reductase flavoprotein subunit
LATRDRVPHTQGWCLPHDEFEIRIMNDNAHTPWHDEADVVVVGSGAAGLTAAFIAANEGLDVLLLEKTAYFGGMTAYSAAGIRLPGNHVVREAGVDDSVELGLEYLSTDAGRTSPELLRAFVETGPDLVRYLTEQSRWLEFVHTPYPDSAAAPGRRESAPAIFPMVVGRDEIGHAARRLRASGPVETFGTADEHPSDMLVGGQALVGRLLAAIGELDRARLQPNSPVTELVVAEGEVTGVVVDSPEGTRRIRARVGVVLAAGGFEANAQARREVHGLPGADWSLGPIGANTGELLDAAVHIGASTDLIDEAWWVPAVLFPNGRAAAVAGIHGGIFVGHDGTRFANELAPGDRVGHDIKAYYDEHDGPQPIWWICDADSSIPPSFTRPVPDEAQFREAGLRRSADTIEGLAEQLELPVEALAATVARFNGFAAAGVDSDFQRTVGLKALSAGPFSAVQIVLGDLGTKGGVRVDADARVMGVDGNPIAGLYAAGNTAASVTGSSCAGRGVPIAAGMVWGYRSALHLARSVALVSAVASSGSASVE